MDYQIEKELSSQRIINLKLLYVSGIPQIMNNDYIITNDTYFGRFGKIESVRKLPGKKTFSSAVFSAFILYKEIDSCKNAIQTIDNSIIKCQTRTGLKSYRLHCTYGTSKYCRTYIKNVKCQVNKCLFIHEKPPISTVIEKHVFSPTLGGSENKQLHDFPSINFNKVFFNLYTDKNFIDLFDYNNELYNYKTIRN
ncbi:CCR4-NOT transcription complex subunit 4 [Cucumispora dikerogammari]|nr:CCR4-NOT transcription complex subunit 4 [Cucumispora dikerogammari]